MRTGLGIVLAFVLAAPCAAQPASAPAPQVESASPPFEIVKKTTDIEADPSGQYWEFEETSYRPLTSLGVQLLQKTTLSYTSVFQSLNIGAYTLKKDGRRIDVPAGKILQGHGDTTRPGFADTRTLTVVFPDLEIGDQAVLLSSTSQNTPWFPGVFATTESFSGFVAVHDASIAFTSRGDDALFRIFASGMTASPPVKLGGKTRRVWHYSNSMAVRPEAGAVKDVTALPHVEISTVPDFAKVAEIYAGLFKTKAAPTPEISALAEKLTAGITDRRAQAKALYDWVASHIQYVDIVLGAGGFEPHEAGAVLKNGYGDCKDHVMLLQALLAVKNIDSSAALIRAGENQFRLPQAASPFLFDHLISYLPEFNLFADSTARYAPFGVLPSMDSGKPVLAVASGKVMTTPVVSAESSSLKVTSTVNVRPDGSADGDTKIVARGAAAIEMRSLMSVLPPDGDADFFRMQLGAGSAGHFQRGQPEALDADYGFTAQYHIGHLVNLPGPGAFPTSLDYKPFSFSQLIGRDLPPVRTVDYVCGAGTYDHAVTVNLPAGVKILALPADKTVTVKGAELKTSYRQVKPRVLDIQTHLRLSNPAPFCSAAEYAKTRPGLTAMLGALTAQIIYQ